ncbi:MAG: hypothetical protein WA917_13780 [Comamonas sp.]
MTTTDSIWAAAEHLLRRDAEELRESSTLASDPDDWTGEEEAKEDYDKHIAAADALAALSTAAVPLQITAPPNIEGETQLIARWLVETPAGRVGAWNRAALEYLLRAPEAPTAQAAHAAVGQPAMTPAHQRALENSALLADIINRRPAMNAGLAEAYAHWTAEVYDLMGAMAAEPANDAAAPKAAPAAVVGPPVKLPFAIMDDELEALRRFDECARDFEAGGHDVRKETMKRLAEIGLVRRVTANIYEHTTFGLSVLGGDFDAAPTTQPAPAAQGDAMAKAWEQSAADIARQAESSPGDRYWNGVAEGLRTCARDLRAARAAKEGGAT